MRVFQGEESQWSGLYHRYWVEFALLYNGVLTRSDMAAMTDSDVLRYWHMLQIVLEHQERERKKKSKK